MATLPPDFGPGKFREVRCARANAKKTAYKQQLRCLRCLHNALMREKLRTSRLEERLRAMELAITTMCLKMAVTTTSGCADGDKAPS